VHCAQFSIGFNSFHDTSRKQQTAHEWLANSAALCSHHRIIFVHTCVLTWLGMSASTLTKTSLNAFSTWSSNSGCTSNLS